jgi:hypothetical protein
VDERQRTLSLPDLSRRLTLSAAVLLLANLVPLYGVAFLGWSVFPVVLLFWFENVVVGFYNALKMAFARPDDIGRWIGKVFLIPFFLFHYGMFTFIHGVFVVGIFGGSGLELPGSPGPSWFWEALVGSGVAWAAIALFVSHGFSFSYNYVVRGEYRRATLENLMKQPYSRVVVLHVVIIASGFLVMALGAPVLGLALLVLIKMGVDVRAHLRERDKFATPSSSPPAGYGAVV